MYAQVLCSLNSEHAKKTRSRNTENTSNPSGVRGLKMSRLDAGETVVCRRLSALYAKVAHACRKAPTVVAEEPQLGRVLARHVLDGIDALSCGSENGTTA